MATSKRRSNLRLLKTPLILGQGDTDMTRHGDCLGLYTYNARTLSTDAGLHAILRTAERIKFHVIILQETKCRRNVRPINDVHSSIMERRFRSRSIGGAGLVVHRCRTSYRFSLDAITSSGHSSPPPSAPKTHQHH
ncbi:hypothetical protein RB195_010224 [Necator americanus]|uniref:Endonuclease/exonuclease/phosphatase domain-containing protein n=1 Tax=Necator americanus TaxID=51031 RepID=A0ABR1CWZ7_NECAM